MRLTQEERVKVLEVLELVLTESVKAYEENNALFICNKIEAACYRYTSKYADRVALKDIVLKYFHNVRPTKTNRFNDFTDNKLWLYIETKDFKFNKAQSWWIASKKGNEQRVLFLKAIIKELKQKIK